MERIEGETLARRLLATTLMPARASDADAARGNSREIHRIDPVKHKTRLPCGAGRQRGADRG